MEVIDFSQFSGINSIFALLAMVLWAVMYSGTEFFKWYRKKQTATATKEQILTSLKRLELLNLMQHSPSEKITIMNLFAEYKKLGGNCYIDEQYQKWLKEN